MVYAGQTIENPVTGEHITFLTTTAETTGESLRFECRVEPGKARLAAHRHPRQTERFTMLEGTLAARVGDERYTLLPGQSLTLPAQVVHQWWNASDEAVCFQVEVTPARNLEATLEAICGLAQFGQLAETYLPVIPVWMQRVGLSMGATLGRLLGYDPTFAAYRTPAPAQQPAAVPSSEVRALDEAVA
jgi:quercetin dioxygenase-like cupin family protein